MPNIPLGDYIYSGNSMYPTFRPGDTLGILPYQGKKIKQGDIVVFFSPTGVKTAHRIVSVSKGFKTQGDNSSKPDPWVLEKSDIIGRVISAKRHNKQFKVYSGFPGRLFSISIKIKNFLRRALSVIFGPLYRRISLPSVFKAALLHALGTKKVIFNRKDGKEVQVMIGSFIIARSSPEKGVFWIRRPFRPLIDMRVFNTEVKP
ncbi:MAG: signal peptidase I [Candidatus Omnitrophica bacterium]|nr:signal peptidase I [Candidatus Omnitrophota bacterium]